MREWGENEDPKEMYKHPGEREWLDDDGSGDCRLTMAECDCDPSRYNYGCAKCDRAINEHIRNLVANSVALPTRKEKVPNSSNFKTDMWVNETDAVGLVMGSNYAAIETLWWFKHLQKIPPMSWNLIVQKHECPYAFALTESIGRKEPKEVLWAPDLRLVLKFQNYYYLIATASFEPLDEIKRRYGEGSKVVSKKPSEVMTDSRWPSTGKGPGAYVPNSSCVNQQRPRQ